MTRATSAIEMQCLAYAVRAVAGQMPDWLAEHAPHEQADEYTKLHDGEVGGHTDPSVVEESLMATGLSKAQARQVAEVVAAFNILGLDKPDIAIVDQILTEKRLAGWVAEVVDVASTGITTQMASSGTQALNSVRGQIGISFNLQNRRAQEFIENASARVAADSTGTLTSILREELVEGITAGESTTELAKRIQASGKVEATTARAVRIARTEAAFAAIKGTEEGWKQSGVVYGWKYLLSSDPCPLCIAVAERLNGRVIKLGHSAFDVGTVIEVPGQKSPTILNYEPDPGKGLVIPATHPACRCDRIAVLWDEI